MQLRKFSLLTGLFFILLNTSAQDKSNAKFGKISPADFANKVYIIDSNAAAVVIADIGSSQVSETTNWVSRYNLGTLAMIYKRYRRIHILNKNGYDVSNFQIVLLGDDDFVKLEELKAVTYNLDNGKVVETKLSEKDIYKDKLDKSRVAIKFTLPNIKEGSIIEIEYKIISRDIYYFSPWSFQNDYPVLWSEYNVSIPDIAGYVVLTQGYQPFFINTRKNDNGDNIDYRWVMKDVPAIKEESYTSTINNHIARVSLQLSEIRGSSSQRVLTSWEDVCSRLLKNENFGTGLDNMNLWLGDAVKPLLEKGMDDVEKVKRIYAYVRDNFICLAHSGMYLTQSLKNVLKTKRGNVADINLLLIAMLKYANLNTEPVILSTRSHGYTYSIYPILEKFNYVICFIHIGNQDIYLDASWPRLGFGKLTPECYNGHARVVNEVATRLNFSPDSLVERKATSISVTINDKGDIKGIFQQMPGYVESHTIRETVKEKGEEEFFKNVKKEYTQEIELSNPKIDNLDKLEDNLNISYEFKINGDNENIIYINPIFNDGYKQNPFKSAERFYPVEMPYTVNKLYSFSITVPENYVIDEIPESTVIKYNDEGDGYFEYKVFRSGPDITIRSKVIFKRTYYQPDEYEILREFFNMIVKKQNEQIVLRKK